MAARNSPITWNTRPNSKMYKYQRPGEWRSMELRNELNMRLQMNLNYQQLKSWFTYLRRLGIIPPGELRRGTRMIWTDQQIEEIIARINLYCRELPRAESSGDA